jgi:hypothetical protein
MCLRTFFCENYDFVKQKLFCEKKYSKSETSPEESDNTSNAGATTWVKEGKTPNLGPFTGNPWVNKIPSNATKV